MVERNQLRWVAREVPEGIDDLRPRIPRGWPDNLHKFTFELEGFEEYKDQLRSCTSCGSSAHFHKVETIDNWVGDLKTSAVMFYKIPIFKCDNCKEEQQFLEPLEEGYPLQLLRTAEDVLVDLGIRPWKNNIA